MKRLLHGHFEVEVEIDKAPVSTSAPAPPSQQEDSPGHPGSETSVEQEIQNDPDGETTEQSKIKTHPSSETAEGSKAHTLQNTSDDSAGFDAHKGAGHKAHIAQACPPRDENGDQEGPGILTAMLPESASNYETRRPPTNTGATSSPRPVAR